MKTFANFPIVKGRKLSHLLLIGIIFFSIPQFLFAQLSGMYTIGSDVSDDFPSFTKAVDSLNSKGVSGPVTFNVRSGFYNEQFAINNVNNTNSENTVTFQSQTGKYADVTNQCPGTI